MNATEATARRDVPAFWDVVRGHMDEKGIADVEELHERFLESAERGIIPVPGRHREKAVGLAEFRDEHLAGTHPMLYTQLIGGLLEIFEIDDRDPRAGELVLSYVCGRPSWGVEPSAPLR